MWELEEAIRKAQNSEAVDDDDMHQVDLIQCITSIYRKVFSKLRNRINKERANYHKT